MSDDSYRVTVAGRAVRIARERTAVVDAMRQRVTAEAIAVMRREGLSDRTIAAQLGVSKSSIVNMAGKARPRDNNADADVADLKHSVWVAAANITESQFVVDQDAMLSYERMTLHGMAVELPSSQGLADTAAREYVQATTGQRIVLYSQARWKGHPDTSRPGDWDQRGRYLIERCPGLEAGKCASRHTPLPLGDLGLAESDALFGSGWPQRRPTAHQVWKLLTWAIEETFHIFDPTYPELEVQRRPGTDALIQARSEQR